MPRRSSRTSTAEQTAKTEAGAITKRSSSTKEDEQPPARSKRQKVENSPKKGKSPKEESSFEEKVKKEDDQKTYVEIEDEKPKSVKIVKSKIAKAGDHPPSQLVEETEDERKHGTLEKGHIYFIFRPRVELEEAHSFDDVARLHILLLPESSGAKSSSDKDRNFRLIIVGQKVLPNANKKRDVLWGEVIEVGHDLTQLRERLGPKTYDTKTRGERHLSAMRVIGRGRYLMQSPVENVDNAPRNSKNQNALYDTFLAYVLSVPHDMGEVQNDFNIRTEGAFHVQVKGPNATSNNPRVRDPKPAKKPKYPKNLTSLFTTKFIACNPPALLDYPGAEILFIPSKHTIEDKVGKDVAAKELEEPASEEERHFEETGVKEALREIGMAADGDLGPLEGHWS